MLYLIHNKGKETSQEAKVKNMLVTRIAKMNKVVVTYQGLAYWFDSMEDAENFMRKVENDLLFQ